ncbi:MAG: hypothetical protein RIG77_17630 [Cyclobacteriaceae bacterium]
MVRKLLFVLAAAMVASVESWAQCAMCKTTIVNNVSHGELNLAEGLNFGILYLFFTPYLAIAAIAIFWYINSRSNAKKNQQRSFDSV